MQLAILTAVVASLAAAEASGEPVAGVAWRLMSILGVILVAPLTALVGTWRLAVRGNATEGVPSSAHGRGSERGLARLQSVVLGLWMSGVIIVLFVAQWPRIVRGNWHLASWPLLDELAILAPVIAPLLLVWAALYRGERAAQVAAFRARNLAPPAPQLGHYLWLHVRHYLGLILLPALTIVAAFDVLRLFHFAADSSSIAWWLAVPLLVTLLLLMPLALRRIFPTTPLAAGDLRDDLEAICREQRCSVREILVWQTGGHMANAAVVGLSRWLRYVLLTDALLDRLTPAQIAAVLRHELAHLRKHHLPLRLALLALPLAWWLAIERVFPDLSTTMAATVDAVGLPAPLLAALGLPAAMLGYALLVVGWYSRLLEHEADLEACRAGGGRFDPPAAIEFCQALIKVIGHSAESRSGQWLHPSLADRLQFLHWAADDVAQTIFDRKLRVVRLAIAAAYLAALLIAVIGFSGIS